MCTVKQNPTEQTTNYAKLKVLWTLPIVISEENYTLVFAVRAHGGTPET